MKQHSISYTLKRDMESLLARAIDLFRSARARLGGSAKRTAQAKDPSVVMFASIRRRLTLWYCVILAVILILSSLILYFSVQNALLGQATNDLSASAHEIVAASQSNPPPPNDGPTNCFIPFSALHRSPYIMCFDPNFNPSFTDEHLRPPMEFQSSSLASRAMSDPHGEAIDIISGDNGLGPIERYALVMRDATGKHIVGVVMVGEPVGGLLTALHALAEMLLVVDTLTLLGATIGGLFLSSRALAPARLAFTRQQSFIADASHELRTPLTLLRADAEVLLRGRNRLPPDDAALLEDIVAESAHMGVLTTNLLMLARLDSGAQHIERDLTDLNEIAAQVVRRASALAEERNITLQGPAPTDDAQPALTLGDAALLEQATLILVDNALKYNRMGGSVTVRVWQAGGRALLAVSDTGIGIPPEHLARLGERFYRVDKARSREAGGAGLGLSIARGIATAHQGTLTLTSVDSEGTTATLSLPAITATPAMKASMP